jgi:hypothetical protein
MNHEPTIIERVKQSAEFVATNSTFVKINEEAIKKFVATLNPEEYRAKVEMDTVFPLKFKSTDHEINFTALIDLLNFGSGFRYKLKEHCGRGAYETICYGVMAMVISDITFDAQFLCSIKLPDAASYFGFPLTEKDSEEPGELYLLAQHLTRAMNEAGLALAQLGYPDFAHFIRDSIQPAADERPKAVPLIDRLVKVFPPFNDTAVYKGQHVFIIKKAQLLAADLHRRFKIVEPKYFDFSDIDEVTVFSDNVLPAVLRKLGILEVVDNELVQVIANRQALPSGEKEVELRLCAVYACKKIVEYAKQAGKQMQELDLDYYLWNKGKDPEFRSFERHHTKDTYYY